MTTQEREALPTPIERHARVPGYDVARAIAIGGMVLINFGVYLLGPPLGAQGEILLRWLAHLPGGRASSLFVTLAGVGIARMAYGEPSAARRTLLARAAILCVLGASNVALGWDIDILHFYACYLAIAALFFLRASKRALIGSAFAIGVLGAALALAFPEDQRPLESIFTVRGVLRDALLDGVHPVLPWLAFLLFGMWLGQLDLRAAPMRRRVLARALMVCIATELASLGLSALVVRDPNAAVAPLLSLVHTDWSPSPLYVLSAAASATSIIALAHELVDRAPKNVVVRILGNAGQLSLTIYLVHAHLAIGIPRFFLGMARAMPVDAMLLYWVAFVALVLPLAALYRARFQRGPVEWLMRAITGSPEHVEPIAPADLSAHEPPRWVWPVLLTVMAALPLADLVGVAPPRVTCPDRVALEVGSETPSQLTLLCPRARFAITLDAPTPLVIATRSGIDVYLEVRRGGAMIAQDDDAGPGLDSRIEATLGPGRYDVDVRPYSAATGPFVLAISTTAYPAEADPTRTPAAP